MITYAKQLEALINLKNNPSLLGLCGICYYMMNLNLNDDYFDSTVYRIMSTNPTLFTYKYANTPCTNDEVGVYCGKPGEMTPERKVLLDLLIEHFQGLD